MMRNIQYFLQLIHKHMTISYKHPKLITCCFCTSPLVFLILYFTLSLWFGLAGFAETEFDANNTTTADNNIAGRHMVANWYSAVGGSVMMVLCLYLWVSRVVSSHSPCHMSLLCIIIGQQHLYNALIGWFVFHSW